MKTKKHKMMKRKARKRKTRKHKNKKKILKQKGGRLIHEYLLLPQREFTDDELFLDSNNNPIPRANGDFRRYA